MAEYDPWALTTGLPDDIDIAIQDAWFEFDPEYRDGEVCVLKLKCIVDDEDNPETELLYSCGDKWEPADKGATTQRIDGKKGNFNQNSAYGLFIAAAVEAGAKDVLVERGTPMEAEIWKGLRFHMNQKEFKYKFQGQDEETVINRLLPTEYQGTVGETAAKAKGTKKASGSKAADTKTTKVEVGGEGEGEGETAPATNGASKVVLAKLRKLAKDAESEDDFLAAAFEVPEVDASQELQDSLTDLYAEANAE